MTRKLTPRSNLDSLRKEAKRWLKAIEAGDAEAIARYAAALSTPADKANPSETLERSEKPKLREIQHALAREHGLPSWAALKQEIEDRARTHAQRVALFLEKSAHRYGTSPATHKWGGYERDGDYRGEHAARLLERHPEIARDSLHTAVAAGDVEAVRGFLAKDPALANERGWIDRWTPLLRLAYTRLPTEAARTNAVEIARLLLDHGADAGARWSEGDNGFSVLTGVIGGGEGGQSAHPQAEALARLLVERGADPLDGQALYNTSLGADDTFWLDLLWSESAKRGETARWLEPVNELMDRPPLEYLLGNAVPRHPKRAAWLLAHGGRGDARNAYSKQPVVLHAAVAGQRELVELLVAHGAEAPVLDEEHQFVAAALQGDIETLRRLAARRPGLLRAPDAMFAALPEDRTDVAEILLDLGMSPDVGDAVDFRALHYSTHCGAVGIAKLLIARGAEIDPVERRYHSTPLGHANYQHRPEMIATIAPVSRDIKGLCFCGAVERLRELLAEDASLARNASRGDWPLFCLPDDDERALEVAELLLAHGADRNVKNADGLTPAAVARQRGLVETAELLAAAARKS
ncbi:MAG TPA: ankyrin repeat domain-containing protein [Gammaproteobacteria bacterium]|nr:ankyrin repeat domain-containing protein [Gammaproteobacteria bacterium]